MSKSFEEHRLVTLLKAFDANLAIDYLDKVRKLSIQVDEENLLGNTESIDHPALINPMGFRVRIREPAYVMFSNSIGRVRARVKYTKEIEWEKFLVMHLGMIPVYLVNLNVITMLKLWGEKSSLVTSEIFQQELQKGTLSLEVVASEVLPEYSSMNFLLLFGASKFKTPDILLSLFQKYYRYAFWTTASSGYNTSLHFFHRRNAITSLIRTSKSLFRITSVGQKKRLYAEGRYLECTEVRLSQYIFTGTRATETRNILAFLPEDIIENLANTKDIKKAFLNGTLMNIQTDGKNFNVLTDIVDVSESSLDLTATLLGMRQKLLYAETMRPCFVSSRDRLLNETRIIFEQLQKGITFPFTVSDCVDKYELALRELFPLVQMDNNEIFFMHPLIVAFLSERGKIDLISNKDSLISVLKLVELAHTSKRRMPILTAPAMKLFGTDRNATVGKLIALERQICFIKHMHHIFDNE